jgi:hypothetical protein
VELVVSDEGPGLLDSRNLFVPFYTTKPEGSGIGLVLAGRSPRPTGTLSLRNAEGRRGCDARLRLPGGAAAGSASGALSPAVGVARFDREAGSAGGTGDPGNETPARPGPNCHRRLARAGACSTIETVARG